MKGIRTTEKGDERDGGVDRGQGNRESQFGEKVRRERKVKLPKFRRSTRMDRSNQTVGKKANRKVSGGA